MFKSKQAVLAAAELVVVIASIGVITLIGGGIYGILHFIAKF